MMEPAATPGPRLKAEREKRNLSLEKVGNSLHLDPWVIQALETDDYAGIGPSVFVKGHLKRYAELLGLPESEILAGYMSRANARVAPVPQPAAVRVPTAPPPPRNNVVPKVVGIAAAALLLLCVLWWKPWQHRAASHAGAPSAAKIDAPASPTAAPMASSRAPAANGATVPPDTALGSGRARLRLSFSADSWVEVHDAEGRRAFSGNGRANSVKTIAGDAPMRVYLGFANGVQLEINNRAVAIGQQFMDGTVARFEAGADGVLRRDSHSVAARSTQTLVAHPTG